LRFSGKSYSAETMNFIVDNFNDNMKSMNSTKAIESVVDELDDDGVGETDESVDDHPKIGITNGSASLRLIRH